MDIKTFFEMYGCFQYHKQKYTNMSTNKEMIQHMYFFSYNATKSMQTPEFFTSVKNIFEMLKMNHNVDYKMKETETMLSIKVSKLDNMKNLIKYLEDNKIKPKSKGYESVKTFVFSKGVVQNVG